MPNAARKGDDHACPSVEPGPTPHVGGPIQDGSPDVEIEFMPAARAGVDAALCKAGGPDKIAQGSATVFINNKHAARIGDMTQHAGVIVGCAGTVEIGVPGDAVTVLPIKKRTGESDASNEAPDGSGEKGGGTADATGSGEKEGAEDEKKEGDDSETGEDEYKGVVSRPVLHDAQPGGKRAPTSVLLRCDSTDLDDPAAPAPTPASIVTRIWAASTFKPKVAGTAGSEASPNWQSWLHPFTGNDGFKDRYCVVQVPEDADAGTYTVYLTVVDQQGETATEKVEFAVDGRPPVAKIQNPIERDGRFWGTSGYLSGDKVTLRSLSYVQGNEHEPNRYIDTFEWELRLMSPPVRGWPPIASAGQLPPNEDGSFAIVRPGGGTEVRWTIDEAGAWLVTLTVTNSSGTSKAVAWLLTGSQSIAWATAVLKCCEGVVLAVGVLALYKLVVAKSVITVAGAAQTVTVEMMFDLLKNYITGQRKLSDKDADFAIDVLELMCAGGFGAAEGFRNAIRKNSVRIKQEYQRVYQRAFAELTARGEFDHPTAVKMAVDRAKDTLTRRYVSIWREIQGPATEEVVTEYLTQELKEELQGD